MVVVVGDGDGDGGDGVIEVKRMEMVVVAESFVNLNDRIEQISQNKTRLNRNSTTERERYKEKNV